MNVRIGRIALLAGAVVGWLLFAFMTWYSLAVAPGMHAGEIFQIDWHVFWSGARDLADRDLYRVPLEANGLALSAPEFRLPPFAAVWPLPLLPLGPETGGVAWQVMAALAIAMSAVLAGNLVGASRPWVAAGPVLGLGSMTLYYLEGLHVGTNNYLVLALVGLGCWATVHHRDSWAGVAFGLAIATKLWPVTVVVLLLRERRWRVLRWLTITLVAQGLLLLAWLGIDVVGPMLRTLPLDIAPTGHLIGPAAVPGLRDAWTGGVGVVVAAAILALPLRGRLGLGAALVAGMALIANLWIHYGPTVLFGLALAWPFTSRRQRVDG